MADSHKNYIRERLVQGLQSTHSKLRTAFGMVISAVANFDWPESWPILMPQLLQLLQSPNQGSLRHIRILTSAIRPRFSLPFPWRMGYIALVSSLRWRQGGIGLAEMIVGSQITCMVHCGAWLWLRRTSTRRSLCRSSTTSSRSCSASFQSPR